MFYLVDTESGDATRLTSSAGYDSGPVWSPDRSLIAFISDRTGSPTLWVMSADGSFAKSHAVPGTSNRSRISDGLQIQSRLAILVRG